MISHSYLFSFIQGMFRESDRVFVPLSVIYYQPIAFAGEVLSIRRPAKTEITRQPSKPHGQRSMFLMALEMMGVFAVSIASWLAYRASQSLDWDLIMYKLEALLFSFLNIPFYLFDAVIEFPLRELYRHGPSFLGWEGEPLAKICSRVTHHGDEQFWKRNMDECEAIYASKEAAAMQVRKPILIGFLLLIAFYMVKSLVEARAMRRHQLDPNMVETYRAITMLTRQLKRAMNSR